MLTAVDTAPYVAGALGVSGVGVWLTQRRALITRWCTWAMTAPVVGGALWLGAPGAATLAAAIGVVCAAEYARLARLPRVDAVVLAVAVATLAVAAWVGPGLLPRLVVVAALAVATVPMLFRDIDEGFRRLAMGVLGLVWLSALTGLVVLGPAALPLFVAVSMADVAAYCGGRLLGGPLLSPLSPAKHWSGVVCAGAVGIGTLALLGALTPALAVAVCLGGPLGDLIESMVKRGAGIKDAGSWLPGFGGLLDRVDSLLVALALALVLT